MRIGLSTNGLRGHTLERAISLAAGLGLEAVEFSASREFEDLGVPGIFPWERDRIGGLKPLLAGFRHIGILAPYSGLDFFSRNPRVRQLAVDHVLSTIDLAKALGAQQVTLRLNTGRQDLPEERRARETTSLLQEFAAHAGERQVRLAVENADYFYPLPRLLKAIQDLNLATVGIALDIPAVFLSRTEPYYLPYGGAAEFIRQAGPALFSVQLHDFDGRSANLPLGRGKIRFEPIVAALCDLEFKQPVIIESTFKGPEEVLDSLAYLRREIDHGRSARLQRGAGS